MPGVPGVSAQTRHQLVRAVLVAQLRRIALARLELDGHRLVRQQVLDLVKLALKHLMLVLQQYYLLLRMHLEIKRNVAIL